MRPAAQGLRSLLAQLLRWRVRPIWYAVALGAPLLLTLAFAVLYRATGGVLPASVPLPVLVLIFFVYVGLFHGGLDEELGWRGYALPRLQARFGALTASLILGYSGPAGTCRCGFPRCYAGARGTRPWSRPPRPESGVSPMSYSSPVQPRHAAGHDRPTCWMEHASARWRPRFGSSNSRPSKSRACSTSRRASPSSQNSSNTTRASGRGAPLSAAHCATGRSARARSGAGTITARRPGSGMRIGDQITPHFTPMCIACSAVR
jgi:hypothetical protein